jgi:hypothetical protein
MVAFGTNSRALIQALLRSLLVLVAAAGAVGLVAVRPAGASSGKVTVPVLLTSSRPVSYPGQFPTLYAKVAVRVGGGTLTITSELGTVVGSGPATQTLVVGLDELPCTPPATGPCTPLGIHHYVAHYSGSPLFNGAVSAPVTTVSELFPNRLGLRASANPAQAGKAISFYASVPDFYGEGFRRYAYVPSGTVTFYDGSTVIGAAPLPRFRSAKVISGGLTAGSHTITAVYSGDADYAPGSVTMTEVVS